MRISSELVIIVRFFLSFILLAMKSAVDEQSSITLILSVILLATSSAIFCLPITFVRFLTASGISL